VKRPRATMAGDGRVVHLVSHGSSEDGAQVTLCAEVADRYREPVEGARLCENCEVTLRQLQQAAQRITGDA
jgi:hypothetical protein